MPTKSLAECLPQLSNPQVKKVIPLSDPKRVSFVREGVIIVVGVDYFIVFLENFIKVNGDRFPEERAFIEALKQHAQSGTIEAAGLKDAKGASLDVARRLDFHLASALKEGKVELFDVAAKAPIDSYIVDQREIVCGPLCGEGRHLFYRPDCRLFLTVRDWVS
jgi:hypothetical protein